MSSSLTQIQLLSAQEVHGFLRGLSQPSLRIHVKFTTNLNLQPVTDCLAALKPLPDACSTDPASKKALPPAALLLDVLAEGLIRLQSGAGLVVGGRPVLEVLRPGMNSRSQFEAIVLVPAPLPQVLKIVAPIWVNHMDALLRGTTPDVTALEKAEKALERWAPRGNNRPLLREAGALGIPVTALPGGVFQLGWGRLSRLFKSSITDSTAAVAAAWTKDKQATNALLRMAGLPVPAQVSVSNLETAIKDAQQLGYPVVLKPINLDQGLGVEPDLRNQVELQVAYERSIRYGRPLLMEKHVYGEDYRVYVVKGELIGVAHRVPAQVVGDGSSNVTELVALVNLQRRTGAAVYKPVELDAEALELLARDGYEPASVIPRGRVQRLRRSANSSRGGSSVDVTHLIHPDNVALCLRAAAVLRLDIAGLDLLIPDIARSWREGGAAFCEVNAQPQMGGAHPWIFERILRRYVEGQGRVPSILVLANVNDLDLSRAIVGRLDGEGLHTVMECGTGATLIERTRAAVIQPDLDAIVVQVESTGLLRQGLPLDRFDALVLDVQSLEAHQLTALQWLAEHISGVVFMINGAAAAGADGERADGLDAWSGCLPPHRLRAVSALDALPAAIFQSICEPPHA